jgi:hypothetical protein
MSNIKDALTRKLGPLPAWAWALVAGIAVYWYRNKGLSLTSSSTTTGGSVTPNSPTPQPITTLAPGESAYDPNTGQLLTSPGGDTTGAGAGGTDIGGSLDSLAQAIEDAISAGSGGGDTSTPSGAPAQKAAPKKTPAKKKVKPKKAPKKIKVGSSKGRSKATHKAPARGKAKTVAHPKAPVRSRSKTPAPAGKRTTGRIRTKLTRPVTAQRPQATHQGAHQEVHPAPKRPAPARTAPRPTPARHSSVPARKPAPAPRRPVAKKR